jgi:hypothetical protein
MYFNLYPLILIFILQTRNLEKKHLNALLLQTMVIIYRRENEMMQKIVKIVHLD